MLAGMIPALALSNPPLVSYMTYLSPASGINYVAIDSGGYLYVSGITDSIQLPCSQPGGGHGAVTK